jgi:hypothetical protein
MSSTTPRVREEENPAMLKPDRLADVIENDGVGWIT